MKDIFSSIEPESSTVEYAGLAVRSTTSKAALDDSLFSPVLTEEIGDVLVPASETGIPEVQADPGFSTGILDTAISPSFKDVLFARADRLDEFEIFLPPRPGVPSSQLGVPFSRTEDITDTTLFEDPADASQKYYLPRYRIAEETISGKQRVRIFLKEANGIATLTVYLQKYPAPEITASAAPLAVTPAVVLKHRLFTEDQQVTGDKELLFQEWSEQTDGTLKAVLSVPGGTNELFNALTMGKLETRLIVRRQVTVGLPVQSDASEPLYRVASRTLDYNPTQGNLFIYDPAINPHIYGDIQPDSTVGFGIKRHVVNSHTYFQDIAQNKLFYYIPDSFKIGRLSGPLRSPAVSINFQTQAGKLEDVQGTMIYMALPVVDLARLETAAQALLPGEKPLFEPFPASSDQIRFRLALPRADGAPGSMEEREGASVDLSTGIFDTVSRPLAGFQALFSALVSNADLGLLRGEVSVEIPSYPEEKIPFIGRVNDLAGGVFDYRDEVIEAGASLAVRLKNAIESPLKVNVLSTHLHSPEGKTPASIQGLAFPVEVNPGEEIQFQVVPEGPVNGIDQADAVFDLSGVQVLVDKEAIWNAVLDPNIIAEYPTTITVKTTAGMFEAEEEKSDEEKPDGEEPEEQLVAILVNFERGATVELNSSQLTGSTIVRLPLKDYLLRYSDEGEYRYQVTAIREKSQFTETQMRTGKGDIFYITDLPSGKGT